MVPTDRTEEQTYRFEKVQEFTYLGVKIRDDGHKEQEITMIKGNKKFGIQRSINKWAKTKERFYKTVNRVTTIYACGPWVLNKVEKEKLERWERKILRAIYDEYTWRRDGVETLYKEPKLTTVVKAQRIKWLGHVHELENSIMSKLILNRRPIEKKRKERLGKRWRDSVSKDLQKMKYCVTVLRLSWM